MPLTPTNTHPGLIAFWRKANKEDEARSAKALRRIEERTAAAKIKRTSKPPKRA